MSIYISALITTLILILIFILLRLLIIKFFESQKGKFKSLTYPVIVAVVIIGGSLTIITTILPSLINIFITFLNHQYNLNIITSVTSDFYNTVNYAIFCLSISTITIFYIIGLRQKFAKNKEKSIQIVPEHTISSPPIPLPVDNRFHQRVKNLFELKHPNLELNYDPKLKVLYGYYKNGIYTYFKIIFCHETVLPIDISESLANSKLENIKSILIENNIIPQQRNILIEEYYILEKGGGIDSLQKNIYTEKTFLKKIINFDKYLQDLIYSFRNDELPFATLTIKDKKITLADTFINPTYNNGNSHLTEYIEKWLNEDNRKHFALMGDSGTGKTSYLKYLAHHLAQKVLDGKSDRIPIYIPLRSTSPIHRGIEGAISEFIVQNRLDTGIELFNKLIHSGNFIFLLDGFDEMGFIGTHEQRFDQLNAIWQLAVKNNKLIIAGRPSYFPNEFEERNILKITIDNSVPRELPFCEKILLDYLSDKNIKISIKAFYKNTEDVIKYFEFIKNNNSIYDLCKRPSMMHIIREMLPYLYKEYQNKNLNANTLMNHYLDHWIERQTSKKIVSLLNKSQSQRTIILSFFRTLAVDVFLEKVSLRTDSINNYIKREVEKLDIRGTESREGLENELITAYFLQRNENMYSFVHKSFFEYFVSLEIVDKLKEKQFSNKLIQSPNWTDGMEFFTYEAIKYDGDISANENIPILLRISNSKSKAWIKNQCFNICGKINHYVGILQYCCYHIFKHPMSFYLKILNLIYKQSRMLSVLASILIFFPFIYLGYYSNTSLGLDLIIIIIGMLLTSLILMNLSKIASSNVMYLSKYKGNQGFALPIIILIHIIIGLIFKHTLIHSLLIIGLSTLAFLAPIMLVIYLIRFNRTFSFISKAYSFSFSRNLLPTGKNQIIIWEYNTLFPTEKKHILSESNIYTPHHFFYKKDIEIKQTKFHSYSIALEYSTLEDIIFYGPIREIIIIGGLLQNITFDQVEIKKKHSLTISIYNLEEQVDRNTIEAIVKLINENKFFSISDLYGSEWLINEVKKQV
ncbi:NACHT domain-containing protein [Aureispira sp. CCB-E]|uniref:NACHT domain-containing protein n=1 Tax=Aureispira sp. CCB-E TaxID=3051121 RepID=UPI002868C05B|nr:NACHT domain-containing protein [Aureispira sp. CCB-E]WMX17112.1 NACHT domain-containing protein [Aureispira sp. CCB-E]